MQTLSMSDAMFLYSESKETPNHVAGLTIVELDESYEGSFYEAYKKILQDRIHEVPIMKWRMEEAPLELEYPRWVEEDELDWDYHVRATSLDRPGSDEQLWEKVSRLHSQLLDRSKPLWEHYIIEGLAGNRVAIYSKIHHACIDGQAGQQVQQVLFDATAEPRGPLSEEQLRKYPFYRKTDRAAPALAGTIARRVIADATKKPLLLEAPKLFNMARKAYEKRDELKNALPGKAPKTILNVPISGQRSFATGSVPLSAMKQVKNATGTTLNDVTVAICGGALRRYLDGKRALPAESLICGAPVALPQKGNSSNNVSMMLLPYHTEIADPIERLKAVHEGAVKAKAATAATLEVTGEAPEVELPAAIARRAIGLFARKEIAGSGRAPMNVVMSNVPGSPVPFYVAGARVVANYPVSIPTHGQAVNITSISYEDRMDFGVIACAKVMSQPRELVALIEDEFATLYEAALGEAFESGEKSTENDAFTLHKGKADALRAATAEAIGQPAPAQKVAAA